MKVEVICSILTVVARDLHCKCIYYPEHVYTWEGYSSHSVSSCVCLSVCLCVST